MSGLKRFLQNFESELIWLCVSFLVFFWLLLTWPTLFITTPNELAVDHLKLTFEKKHCRHQKKFVFFRSSDQEKIYFFRFSLKKEFLWTALRKRIFSFYCVRYWEDKGGIKLDLNVGSSARLWQALKPTGCENLRSKPGPSDSLDAKVFFYNAQQLCCADQQTA